MFALLGRQMLLHIIFVQVAQIHANDKMILIFPPLSSLSRSLRNVLSLPILSLCRFPFLSFREYYLQNQLHFPKTNFQPNATSSIHMSQTTPPHNSVCNGKSGDIHFFQVAKSFSEEQTWLKTSYQQRGKREKKKKNKKKSSQKASINSC